MSRAKCQVDKTKTFGYTNNQIKKINAFRKTQGLSLIEIKKRECLRCSIEFESMCSSNRLCDTCIKYPASHHDWGTSVNTITN